MSDGYALTLYDASEVGGVLLPAGASEDEASADRERPEYLPQRCVEAEGGFMKDSIIGVEVVGGLRMRLTSPRCVSIAPLGLPVEPEV